MAHFFLKNIPRQDSLANLRREFKFEYEHVDVRKLEMILKVNNRPIIHKNKETLVSSIYFDDCGLTSYRENLAGIGKRFKLRLRWYDSDFPETRFFFEVKKRANTLIFKNRYEIGTTRSLGKMSFREIVDELKQLLPDEPRELLRLRPDAVVLVRYRRRHFAARDPRLPVRLTLDHNILGFGQISRHAPHLKFKSCLDGRIVVEVKAAPGLERHVPRLLYPLRPRLSRFSKYVLCCMQTGVTSGLHAPVAV